MFRAHALQPATLATHSLHQEVRGSHLASFLPCFNLSVTFPNTVETIATEGKAISKCCQYSHNPFAFSVLPLPN